MAVARWHLAKDAIAEKEAARCAIGCSAVYPVPIGWCTFSTTSAAGSAHATNSRRVRGTAIRFLDLAGSHATPA